MKEIIQKYGKREGFGAVSALRTLSRCISIMEKKDYNKSNKSLFEEQQPTKTYKVKEMENGVAIKLEGYPLSFIRIIKDTRFNKYSILIRDNEGWAVKLNKSADNRVIAATLLKIKEDICT